MEPLQTNHEAYRFLSELGVLKVELNQGAEVIAASPGVSHVLYYAHELMPRVEELWLAFYWAGCKKEVFCVDLWLGKPEFKSHKWWVPLTAASKVRWWRKVMYAVDPLIPDSCQRSPLFRVRDRSVRYPGRNGLGEQMWVDCYINQIMDRGGSTGASRFPAVSMKIVWLRGNLFLSKVRLFQIRGALNQADEDVKRWLKAWRGFVRLKPKEGKA